MKCPNYSIIVLLLASIFTIGSQAGEPHLPSYEQIMNNTADFNTTKNTMDALDARAEDLDSKEKSLSPEDHSIEKLSLKVERQELIIMELEENKRFFDKSGTNVYDNPGYYYWENESYEAEKMKLNTMQAELDSIVDDKCDGDLDCEVFDLVELEQEASAAAKKATNSTIAANKYEAQLDTSDDVKPDDFTCNATELKKFTDKIIKPLQSRIKRIKTPEKKCMDWFKTRQKEQSAKGNMSGGCVSQICGDFSGWQGLGDFGLGGMLGKLGGFLSDPLGGIQDKLKGALDKAVNGAMCGVGGIAQKLVDKVGGLGNKLNSGIRGFKPGEIIGAAVSKEVKKGLNKVVGNTLGGIAGSIIDTQIYSTIDNIADTTTDTLSYDNISSGITDTLNLDNLYNSGKTFLDKYK